MFRRLLIASATLLLIGVIHTLPEPVHAVEDCEVRDVIDMVYQGDSRNQIRDRCGNEIDVRKCSLTQVIQMAEDGESSREIYTQCRKVSRK